jgi:uncharacterized protein
MVVSVTQGNHVIDAFSSRPSVFQPTESTGHVLALHCTAETDAVMRAHAVEAQWDAWDGSTSELLRLGWESGGWTADGRISGLDVHYAIRYDAEWRVRQFLLFRDLDQPDLWLVTDGRGRWGEMNGAERPELVGCTDVHIDGSPFAMSLSGRRLGLINGQKTNVLVARVDTETLDVSASLRWVQRVTDLHWSLAWATDFGDPAHEPLEFDVDEHHLTLTIPGHFRRVPR